MRLADKVSIITGAGGGMGRVAARMFAEQGARVVVAEFGEGPGRETVDQITAAGGQATFVRADVSKEADAKAMVDHAISTYGRLDVLYNNAGIMPAADHSVTDTDVDVWDQVMAVNLRGVFLCAKRAIEQMLGQEPVGEVRGRFIAISSQHGMIGPPGHVAYAASKGGVVNLVRQLAVDFGPRGVLVNAVAPGKILTGSPEQQDPETLAYSQARTPFHRLGRPDDVAGAAVFLASDDSGYVSGTNLLVDGGWMAY